jgi:putative ribosome biogenesis GTPase RsgA
VYDHDYKGVVVKMQAETSGPAGSLPPPQQRVLVLVGPPGSGKSTLAALLQPDFYRISQDVRSRHTDATAYFAVRFE